MIDTPNTFWKPAANTTSHSSGRTSAEASRPPWRTNLASSRLATACSASRAWAGLIGILAKRTGWAKAGS